MDIKILGMGCKNCIKLYQEVEEALNEIGVEASIKKIEDVLGIKKYRVMRTPGLVINEKVKSYGKVPKKEEIIQFIKEELLQ